MVIRNAGKRNDRQLYKRYAVQLTHTTIRQGKNGKNLGLNERVHEKQIESGREAYGIPAQSTHDVVTTICRSQ